jgi:hypothetical protein
MSKQKLIARWHSGPFAAIKKDLAALLNQANFVDLKQLAGTTPEGRLDLRGLQLPSLVTDQISFHNSFENVDFSYADLGQSVSFENAKFINCQFTHCDLECRFWGCSYENCVFERCRINTCFGSTHQRVKSATSLKYYYNLQRDGGGCL